MRLKLLLAALVALAAVMPARAADPAPMQERNVVGLRAGFLTRNTTAVAGLFYQYRFSRFFRLSPNVDYVFRHHDVDALGMNLNCHFPMTSDPLARWAFYPIAGLSLTSWTHHEADPATYDDVTTRRTRWGMNLGCGFELMCSPTLKLSVEAKANLVKSYSAGMFTMGIAYVF